MNRLPMFLAASFTLTIAGTPLAADPRSPVSTDEARSVAAELRADAPVPAFTSVRVRTPSSTDEIRAAAGAQLAFDAARASGTVDAERADRTPFSTDEARARTAARTSQRRVSAVRAHEEMCTTCVSDRG